MNGTNGNGGSGLDVNGIVDALGAGRPPRPQPPISDYARKTIEALKSFGQATKHRVDLAVRGRFDAWANDVTGFGTTRDKTTYGYILPDRIFTDSELSALFHFDDMAARMINIVPQEMFREGFSVSTGAPALDAALKEKHRALGTALNLEEGHRWGRCFGGGATILGCDDGRPADMELIPERADDLEYLYTIDRRLLWPVSYYGDDTPAKIGQVRTYMVTRIGGMSYSQAEVHESRLVLHRGMPTGGHEKVANAGWDYSVLQSAYESLRGFNSGWKSTETLMVDGNQAVISIGGLQAIIASGGEELLRDRMRAMDMFRSVTRAIVLDADAKETFERKTANYEGLPNTLDKIMLRLAATVEIPVTILMGQSPAGMNATGDSDFRWFYNRIGSKQRSIGAPQVERVTSVFLRTRKGQEMIRTTKAVVTQVEAKFPDLWTELPKDRAQREQAIATRDATYIREGVFSPKKVALVRGRPDGFNNEIILTDEEAKKLEEDLKAEAELTLVPDETQPEPGTVDPNAPVVPVGGATDPNDPLYNDKPDLKLAPTDAAVVITVNEARASMNLPAFKGADGQLTLTQYKAKNSEVIAVAAGADAGQGQGDLPPDEETPPKVDTPGRFDAKPRTFTLQHDVDETGVSGTGEVAYGCLFSDGRAVLRWATKTASTTMFDSMDDVLKVHGHSGLTHVVWDDE